MSLRRACVLLTALFLLKLTPEASAAAPAPRTALVIGNAKYEAAVGPLRNTVNDAKAVAKTLRGLGFAVIEEHNVTRDELLQAVLAFRKTLANAEVGLFYYAGHGISVSGSNYLLPLKSGYSPEGADDVTLRMLAETRLFNVEQAVADMKAAGARCNLIILDACRTTAVARTGRTRDAASPGGLAEMKPPAGSLIAFATDAGQTALDGDGTNGLYTEELLKHLRTPGLTIEQVFKRTRAAVLERSQGGQIPAEYSRLIGEDIFLAGPALPAPPPASPPEPTPAPAVAAATREVMPPPAPPPAPPVVLPTQAEINKLATRRKAKECVEALQQLAESRGPGDYAIAPLETLLEQVKDDLKEAKDASPQVEAALQTCALVVAALRDCLPPEHPKKATLTAKAQNRRGDCLLLFGRADEALEAYNGALSLTPEDAYRLQSRPRASGPGRSRKGPGRLRRRLQRQSHPARRAEAGKCGPGAAGEVIPRSIETGLDPAKARQRPGVRQPSGAFERPQACAKLQRAGALQNARRTRGCWNRCRPSRSLICRTPKTRFHGLVV